MHLSVSLLAVLVTGVSSVSVTHLTPPEFSFPGGAPPFANVLVYDSKLRHSFFSWLGVHQEADYSKAEQKCVDLFAMRAKAHKWPNNNCLADSNKPDEMCTKCPTWKELKPNPSWYLSLDCVSKTCACALTQCYEHAQHGDIIATYNGRAFSKVKKAPSDYISGAYDGTGGVLSLAKYYHKHHSALE